MVNAENLTHYLLERGLVSYESVVNGSVQIAEIPRRNHNFKVTQQTGPGYFLKQVRNWDPETLRTIQVEAECYKLARETQEYAELKKIVPRFHSFDQRHAVLITELLEPAETIADHHFRNNSFPVTVAEELGEVFGKYHRSAQERVRDLGALFPRRPAWSLSLHQNFPEARERLSGGNYQMLAMLRQFPQFGTVLDKLRANWRFDALIHADIKWDNCLLCPGANGKPALRIVDWEMADVGDSCWDVGSIFSAYLTFWVQSLPGHNLMNAEALVAQARFPIETMHPAIRAFWQTYLGYLDVPEEVSRELLNRSVQYAGARMIQTAFEVLRLAPRANPVSVLLLQLSMNVLTCPEEARSELLGLETL